MRRSRIRALPLALTLTLGPMLAPLPAHAGRHVVQRGETLEHVAKVYGCTTEAVLRANKLKTTLVKAGTVVTVPACSVATRTRTRARRDRKEPVTGDQDDRAALALAVIDGTAVVKSGSRDERAEDRDGADGAVRRDRTQRPQPGASGAPWNGRLRDGEVLPAGDGYRIRRPHRAYGAEHVVAHLRGAIAGVRALYDVHTLAIGDLSARGGGKLDNHSSHQTGLDVDVGFYFHRVPEGYPDRFATASADLDLEANWALLLAFVRTTHLPTGAQMIFLDYDVQRRLYAYARKRGTPEDELATLFQYPRGKDALVGLVRHWPHHADHFHVRFKPDR